MENNFLVVTDLDGTLMDHKYNLDFAIPTIERLKSLRIPLIPCTSKTFAEVNKFRKINQLNDPFIVENGGAIYGLNKIELGISEIHLGRKHSELRKLLDQLSFKTDSNLIAFQDLSKVEIENLTGLKDPDIELAINRQWSVPFITPRADQLVKIKEQAYEMNLNIVEGNILSHLLDKNTSKGNAIKRLRELTNRENYKIIALGDSPNDRSMLDVADIPIVVPGLNGPNKCFSEEIRQGKFILAPAPHSMGWSKAVRHALNIN